jgi:hypothetical protein
MPIMSSSSSQNIIIPLFWRLKDLPEVTRLSLRSINRLRAVGRLPKPDAVFGRALCFKPETIQSWVDAGGMTDQHASR